MNETEVARLDVIKLEQFEHARCQIHEVDEFQLEAVRALRSAASHLLAACFDLDEPFGQICLECADMLHCIYPRLGLDSTLQCTVRFSGSLQPTAPTVGSELCTGEARGSDLREREMPKEEVPAGSSEE